MVIARRKAVLPMPGMRIAPGIAFYLSVSIRLFGTSFQGALRTVLPRAEAHERAGLLFAIYIVSYLGLSVPVVIAGVVINHGTTLVHTSEGFAGVVILLSALALAALVVRRTKPGRQAPQVARPDDVMARAGCLEAY